MTQDVIRELGIKPYDTASELEDDEEARLYVLACVEEAGNNAAFIAKALGTVAKSRVAMAEVAARTGLSRESLYKALSGKRDPAFSTILKVAEALGLRLGFTLAPQKEVQAADQPRSTQPINVDLLVGGSIPLGDYAPASSIGAGAFILLGAGTPGNTGAPARQMEFVVAVPGLQMAGEDQASTAGTSAALAVLRDFNPPAGMLPS